MMLRNCRTVMIVDEVSAPKAAIVLRRTMRPHADVADRPRMSSASIGLDAMSASDGMSVVKMVAALATRLMRMAKMLTKIIWSSTGESGPNGSVDVGARPKTRSCVVLRDQRARRRVRRTS